MKNQKTAAEILKNYSEKKQSGMTAKEYKSLGVAERRVFFIAALVPVDIHKELDEDGTARYVGFADLLGAESETDRAEVLAAVASLEKKGVLRNGRPSVRTTRDTLAVIAQEADKRGWWPSKAVLAKSFEKIHRSWGLAGQEGLSAFRTANQCD